MIAQGQIARGSAAATASTLMPASWRGVKFAVTSSSAGGGRRLALHQYPGKESGWAEDMGQGLVRYPLRGFVLDGDKKIGGQTIAMQRSALIKACMQKGSGTLVHPTLGNLTVALPRWNIGEGLDASNYSEVDFEFIDAGAQAFPTVGQSKSGSVSAASKLKTALLSDAVLVLGKLASGQSISALTLMGMGTGLLGVAGVSANLVATVAGWSAKAILLAQDATSLVRLTAVLPGNYGRFSTGGNSGLTGSNASAYSSSTTVADLISAASTQRVAVAEAAAAFETVAANTDLANAVDLQPAATALMDALVASCADPADAIRLLLQLIASTVDGLSTQAGYVVSQLVLRAAAAALCEAAAAYQPQSATDAAARIAQICPVLDQLSVAASAMGDDGSFATLSACRGAVALDLRTRGATLAQVATFSTSMPMPALALAQRLYGDATRADQLVAQADPANPLFFPTSFQALAS
ncbi:MAG: DNA circularization N-terminal domain-containing protein [Methylovirgula sp.]|nr:DNA circularization N-terminal domain-containing protein [Methylovirgula sp.]